MKQPISITDISSIRPMFSQGASENIKRYQQLKKLFEREKNYLVFAEPVPAGGNKISWHTEFDGNIVHFNELSNAEKETTKGKLKYQINQLYKNVIKHLTTEKQKQEDLFNLLDSCIEIPDYEDILIIRKDNGDQNFVIIRWGFTSDNYNAETGLIQKIIPIKVLDIDLKTIYSDNSSAPNQRIILNYHDQERNLISNEKGQAYLQDIPFFTPIKAWQEDSDLKKINIQEYICDDRDNYLFRIALPNKNIKIELVDKKNKPIKNVLAFLEYDGNKIEVKTNKKGQIELNDVPIGTQITIYQHLSEPSQFVCEANKDLYKIIGTPPHFSMRFLVQDDKDHFIENAHINFKVGDNIYRKTANEYGNIILENMFVDNEVIAEQIIDGEIASSQIFTCQGQNTVNKIIGVRPTEPESVTLHTLATMQFQFVNAKNDYLDNFDVTFEYDGEQYVKQTNSMGIITFSNFKINSEILVKAKYHEDTFEKKYICQSNNEFHQIMLGERKISIWVWLLPLLLLLLAALAYFLYPFFIDWKNNLAIVPPVADTTEVMPPPEEIAQPDMRISIIDNETRKPIENAQIDLVFYNAKQSETTDSIGEAGFFNVPIDSLIRASVKADSYKELKTSFVFLKNKTIYLSKEASFEVSEVPLDCGSLTESGGFGTTIKVYRMKMEKGRFKLFFNMFDLPDKLIIYNGSADKRSPENIIWQTKGAVRNINNLYIEFNSPDSLITVETVGLQDKTEWIYKIFCPRKTN